MQPSPFFSLSQKLYFGQETFDVKGYRQNRLDILSIKSTVTPGYNHKPTHCTSRNSGEDAQKTTDKTDSGIPRRGTKSHASPHATAKKRKGYGTCPLSRYSPRVFCSPVTLFLKSPSETSSLPDALRQECPVKNSASRP